jgi:hypothetical protein
MSAIPGEDYRQPATEPARTLQDGTNEPVGYNLGGVSMYEQPPLSVALPGEPSAPTPPLPTREATAGFVLSLVGLAATPFLPVFTFALVAAGLVLSAFTLRECRRGVAGGRGRARAGLVLGILGIALTALVFLDFMTGSLTISPR